MEVKHSMNTISVQKIYSLLSKKNNNNCFMFLTVSSRKTNQLFVFLSIYVFIYFFYLWEIQVLQYKLIFGPKHNATSE